MKKVISLLLSVVMLFSIISAFNLSAFSAMYYWFESTEYVSGNYRYRLSEDTYAQIIKYTGKAKSIKIPQTVGGHKVVDVSINNCSTIEKVTIPKSIVCFNNGDLGSAFRGCLNLKEINVESSNKTFYSKDGVLFLKDEVYDDNDKLVEQIRLERYPAGKDESEYTVPKGTVVIDPAAFEDSKNLKKVNFPDTVERIEPLAFCDSGLKSVTLPKKIVDLAYDSFFRCSSLTSVGIPKSVKSIQDAFRGCEKITDVYYQGTKAQWKKIEISGTALSKATIHYNAEIDCLAGHSEYNDVTSATLKKNGKSVTKCSACGKTLKTTTIYYPKTITLSKTSYVYDGKVKKPTVTVKDSKGNKISSKYYTVTYSSGRKAVGTYTVTIK
ncbi:MAG: leucine-rich repeat protein, partial [Eubacterium sp.]